MPTPKVTEKKLLKQYNTLCDTVAEATRTGDSAARITAEQNIADVGAQLDAVRSAT